MRWFWKSRYRTNLFKKSQWKKEPTKSYIVPVANSIIRVRSMTETITIIIIIFLFFQNIFLLMRRLVVWKVLACSVKHEYGTIFNLYYTNLKNKLLPKNLKIPGIFIYDIIKHWKNRGLLTVTITRKTLLHTLKTKFLYARIISN